MCSLVTNYHSYSNNFASNFANKSTMGLNVETFYFKDLFKLINVLLYLEILIKYYVFYFKKNIKNLHSCFKEIWIILCILMSRKSTKFSTWLNLWWIEVTVIIFCIFNSDSKQSKVIFLFLDMIENIIVIPLVDQSWSKLNKSEC